MVSLTTDSKKKPSFSCVLTVLNDEGRCGSACEASITSATPSNVVTDAARVSEESLLFLN